MLINGSDYSEWRITMKQFLQDYNMVFAMAAVGCLTIMMKSITAIVYYKLISQAEQMGTTGNKYMKAITGKFIASYKLKREVHDVRCIVEKCMYNMRFMGISVVSWKNADLYGISLILLILGAGVIGGVYCSMTMEWYGVNASSAGAAIILIATSEILFQTRRKYRVLQLQMTDYLDNVLKPKLEKEYLHPEEEKKYQQEYFKEEENTQLLEEEEAAPSMEQLKLFEEFVEEYLSE